MFQVEMLTLEGNETKLCYRSLLDIRSRIVSHQSSGRVSTSRVLRWELENQVMMGAPA